MEKDGILRRLTRPYCGGSMRSSHHNGVFDVLSLTQFLLRQPATFFSLAKKEKNIYSLISPFWARSLQAPRAFKLFSSFLEKVFSELFFEICKKLLILCNVYNFFEMQMMLCFSLIFFFWVRSFWAFSELYRFFFKLRNV